MFVQYLVNWVTVVPMAVGTEGQSNRDNDRAAAEQADLVA